MPFSYFPEKLATDVVSQVRMLMGDTNAASYYLHDEEITFLVTEDQGNIYFAASRGCENIATQFAGRVQTHIGDLSLAGGLTQSNAFTARAKALRRRGMRHAVPVLINTGMYDADKDTDRDDDALTQPRFTDKQFDNFESTANNQSASLLSDF